MARRYRCRFLLMGRSRATGSEPDWARGCEVEQELRRRAAAAAAEEGRRATPVEIGRMVSDLLAARDIGRTLDAVAQAGGSAMYAEVDVTDPDAVRQVIATHVSAGDSVTGVIHAAGLLADKPIERKSLEDFKRVYAPKVTGLFNLLTCIPQDDLRYLILFSSAAAWWGNPGQADYALANEVLNKAAYRLQTRLPDCTVLAIDWGPWDGGMVTPELKGHFTRRGVQLIAVDDGVQSFLSLLQHGAPSPQVVVGTGNLAPVATPPNPPAGPYRVHRRLSLEANPFLRDHIIGSHAVLPAVSAGTWIAHTCEDLFPGYSVASIDDMTVLKGIIFDNGLASDYVLEVTEGARELGSIVCEARVWSRIRDGGAVSSIAVRHHYSGRVTLQNVPHESPPSDRPDLSVRGDPIEGSALYGGAVLFHGPSFQGVRRVLWADPEGIALECCVAPLSLRDQGQFTVRSLNPFILDVQLQSQVIWARLFQMAVSLPVRGARYEFFRQIAFSDPFYVVLRVRVADTYRTVADITSYDAQGRVCMRMIGSETTSNQRLNEIVQVGAAR